MKLTAPPSTETRCPAVSEILSRVGDKWTVQVIVQIHAQPRRFNDLKRQILGISQQMLTRTLKLLERDGLVHRTVLPSTPPQVEYGLTELGKSLAKPLHSLAEWSVTNTDAIHESRARHDKAKSD